MLDTAATSPFLTIAEVATLLRVSKMTVYRLVGSGDLQAARVGRSLRVPQREVRRYVGELMAGSDGSAA
jgi:excisionase family DNA binding protein